MNNNNTYPPPYMCSVDEGCGGSNTDESGLEPEPCCPLPLPDVEPVDPLRPRPPFGGWTL